MKYFQTAVVALATVPAAIAQSSTIASDASSALASLVSSASVSATDSVVASVTSSVAASVSPSGSAAAAVQTVAVGQGGLVFVPDTVNASVGSQIEFVFSPNNHSVVQSDFENPCQPSNGGIFSGFVPTSNGNASQTFIITIQDTNPIWLYCSQNLPGPHCANGMAMVVNPPSGGNTLAAYKAAAAARNATGGSPSSPSGGDLASGTPTSGSPSNSAASATASSTGGAMPTMVSVGAVGGLAAAVVALML